MLVIENQEHFDQTVAFAKKAGFYDNPGGNYNTSLRSRLDYLEQYGKNDRTRVRLFPDGAPHSFYFVIEQKSGDGEWECLLNGGLLFHGPHDGLGSGGGPTFACTLVPTRGWSIHT